MKMAGGTNVARVQEVILHGRITPKHSLQAIQAFCANYVVVLDLNRGPRSCLIRVSALQAIGHIAQLAVAGRCQHPIQVSVAGRADCIVCNVRKGLILHNHLAVVPILNAHVPEIRGVHHIKFSLQRGP